MILEGAKTWDTKNKGRQALEVHGYDLHGKVVIDLEARWKTNNDGFHPLVCWKAVGPVSSTIAREFAQAILRAADIADAAPLSEDHERQIAEELDG